MSDLTRKALTAAALLAIALPAQAQAEVAYQGRFQIESLAGGCFGIDQTETIRILMVPANVGGNTNTTRIGLYRQTGVMLITKTGFVPFAGSVAGTGNMSRSMANNTISNFGVEGIKHTSFVFTPANILAAPDTFKLTGTITGGFYDTDPDPISGCSATFTANLAKLP